jgi:hypothetical protein
MVGPFNYRDSFNTSRTSKDSVAAYCPRRVTVVYLVGPRSGEKFCPGQRVSNIRASLKGRNDKYRVILCGYKKDNSEMFGQQAVV